MSLCELWARTTKFTENTENTEDAESTEVSCACWACFVVLPWFRSRWFWEFLATDGVNRLIGVLCTVAPGCGKIFNGLIMAHFLDFASDEKGRWSGWLLCGAVLGFELKAAKNRSRPWALRAFMNRIPRARAGARQRGRFRNSAPILNHAFLPLGNFYPSFA